jgi:pimeloyl-ACP methyl ester carboxylesterase
VATSWLHGFWVTLLAAVVAVGATGAQATAGPSQHTLMIDGQEALVMKPDQPTNSLVVYVHGAGGTAATIEQGQDLGLAEELLARGFAVAGTAAHGTLNWGDPPSVQDYVRLIKRLHYRHVFLLAESLGGLDGMQLLERVHPTAFAAIYPVCNARVVYRNAQALARSGESIGHELVQGSLETYGGPPPERLSPVRPGDVEGLPVLIWASPADRVVPFQQDAATCASELKKGGASVRLVRTVGDHGDPSNFRPRWLATFFESQLQSPS